MDVRDELAALGLPDNDQQDLIRKAVLLIDTLREAAKEHSSKLDNAEERIDLTQDQLARVIEQRDKALLRLGTLQSERDGAFALIYELMRDEHFIHGRDSWFKRAHELCGDVCTPGIHAFNSEDAELCQCGQRRADGSVVERPAQ